VVVALLMVFSFLVTWSIQARLLDLRVFYSWDLWFQSDPNVNLDALTRQRLHPQIVFRHPIVGTIGYALTMGVARAIQWLRLSNGTVLEIGQWLVLLIMPTAASIRTWLTFDLVRRLVGRAIPAVLLCLLDAVAFHAVIVGSVPDTFTLTGLCTVGMLWLMMDDAPRRPWVRRASWLAMSIVAVGITITNAVPLLLAMIGRAVRRGESVRQALYAFAAVAAVAFSLNGALVLATFGPSAVVDVGMVATREDLRRPAGPVVGELAWAVSHTFIAPRPVAEPSWTSPAQNPEYDLVFSYAPPYQQGLPGAWRTTLTLVILAAGIAGFRLARAHATLLAVSAAMFTFAVTTHLFFGDHFVLYAPHWQAPMLVALAGVALHRDRWRWFGSAALALFTVICAANSFILVRDLLHRLAAA
jgi:hypothetical protein